MTPVFFVTGTDTDVGKTLISAGLLIAARAFSTSCIGIKPIAAGCEETSQGLQNSDALALIEAASEKLKYSDVNPIALKAAIAPYIAAEQAGESIELASLVKHCRTVMERYPGFVLLEGAGGWRVPLNQREFLSDLPIALNIPVILVIAMRLGCINHALLTAEAIRNDGLIIAGWVANSVTKEMPNYDDNLLLLQQKMNAPLLGCVPFLEQTSAESVALHLNLVPLM